MPRNRRRKKPLWIALPLWAAVMLLVAWGVVQLAEFRKKLLSGAEIASAAAIPDTQPAELATPPQDPTTQQDTTPAPTTDPWLEATTPATFEAPDPATTSTAIATNTTMPTLTVDAPLPNSSQEEISEQVVTLTNNAGKLLDAGRIVEARSALNTALNLLPLENSPTADRLREQLSSLNIPVFLGTAVLPEDPAAFYIDIASGDSYLKLGHKYQIPGTLIAAINPGLNPKNLKLGTGIKIIRGPFNLRLLKHANRIDLAARDQYVCSFPATIEQGNFLPHGLYRIKSDSKIALATGGKKTWIGFEGADDTSREITDAWLYASSGIRTSGPDDHPTGIKLTDEDLATLFNTLVESRSLLRVDP